jgi:hypothetical protein
MTVIKLRLIPPMSQPITYTVLAADGQQYGPYPSE